MIALFLTLMLTWAYADWFDTFCNTHIFQHDPYQFRDLDQDSLVTLFYQSDQVIRNVITKEIHYRLIHSELTRDAREVLYKLLIREASDQP